MYALLITARLGKLVVFMYAEREREWKRNGGRGIEGGREGAL